MKLSIPTATIATATATALALALVAASLGCLRPKPPTAAIDAPVGSRRAASADVAETATTPADEARRVEAMTASRRSALAEAENRAERLEERADLDAVPEGRRRAKEALDRLNPFATIRDDPSGTLLRLDDSILFEGDTAQLMPTARERLDRVAQALQEVHARSILVRGYMDRTQDPARDTNLSQSRAEAVRQYLIARGVPRERARAQGLGASEPVQSNASVEGRNENRRIEIVIEGMSSLPTKH
jgi:outer membrane protein OmpA-like peptidoglycan-associated protein